MINDIVMAIANKCLDLNVEKIYTDCIPEDYVRPSIFIDFIRPTNKVLNNAIRQVDYHFQLIYLTPVDSYGNSKRVALFDMSENLRHCFSDDILTVSKDKFRTEYTDGEIVRDGITSDLVVTTYQPRVFKENGEEIAPIMQEIIINRN